MNCQELYQRAHEAGMAAGNANQPTPMIVGSPTNVFGNDIDFNQRTYFVEGGVCGFSWINLMKATGPFVKYLKSRKIGYKPDRKGYVIWCGEFGQSMSRKEAYAGAFARVLGDAGIDAYCESRMD